MNNSIQSIVQLAVSGLAMGLIYCLVAIEFTLILNTSGLVNFGHDQYIKFGAYLFGGTFTLGLVWGRLPSIAGTMILMVTMGIVVAVVVFNPLRYLPSLYAMTGTMALSMIMLEVIRLTYGAKGFNVLGFMSGNIRFNYGEKSFIALPRAYVYIIMFTVILIFESDVAAHKP